jgi:AmmeMemoRadiSam system protein A/AmmeMemoRadiSam system protein B
MGAFILPHPPIIMPEIGRGEEDRIRKTIDSFHEIAKRVEALKPETIVLTSPHSILYSDYFHISPGASAKGDMRKFNAPDISVDVKYDTEFTDLLELLAQEVEFPAGVLGERDASLDHGTVIPLSFINSRYRNYKLVRIGLSSLSFADHYRLGMLIAKAAENLSRNVVFIASGDLSHKVAEDGPYGYAEEGVLFDRQITKAMASGDFLSFLLFPLSFTEKAAECGLRSCIIMAGALDGKKVRPELLSYEGTFGVGYAIASFTPEGEDPGRRFLETYLQRQKSQMQMIKDGEDAFVRLARYSVEYFVRNRKQAALPEGLPDEMYKNKAGVFVTLKKHGNLRGCIGTIAPVTGSIAEEILKNAVSSCSEDPRFDRVETDELDDLVYSVDILSPAEPIDSLDKLDVRRYGVIVSYGYKRGLLLPNLDGVDTVEQQIQIALQKAGISRTEKYALERFEVVRHQ